MHLKGGELGGAIKRREKRDGGEGREGGKVQREEGFTISFSFFDEWIGHSSISLTSDNVSGMGLST